MGAEYELLFFLYPNRHETTRDNVFSLRFHFRFFFFGSSAVVVTAKMKL